MKWLYTKRFDSDKRYAESMGRDARERCLRMVEAEKREENGRSDRRIFAFTKR
jgi:hypothetical protein